jgi:hypothetical protein
VRTPATKQQLRHALFFIGNKVLYKQIDECSLARLGIAKG